MISAAQAPADMQRFYARKLYALLQGAAHENWTDEDICKAIPELTDCKAWWNEHSPIVKAIGSASDRANLNEGTLPEAIEVRHPISGQSQALETIELEPANERIDQIHAARERLRVENNTAETLKRLFWWCWRFYLECREDVSTASLNPAHRILPDCPIPSYNSTVSALTGAMFPPDWQQQEPEKPYLLLFTFSPVQEFIKASRKFADFWSGSYMLHYLSARLCWVIAEKYGPNAVITPSLWNQEIIDALLIKAYPEFEFADDWPKGTPVSQFEAFTSRSLSTAGFPNAITALVPGKENAINLGKQLQAELIKIWQDTAQEVRRHVKERVMEKLSGEGFERIWKECQQLFPEEEQEIYQAELKQLQQQGCWEWNKLWNAQIDNTWQPYFVAIPLGSPECDAVHATSSDKAWIQHQHDIALPRTPIPTLAEQQAYQTLNVGTWWGSLQARLGQSMQAIKNTRRWQLPTSPGERSSLSGQFSALHPRLHYEGRLKYGRGMTAGSIRLFWQVMAIAYPGLFDGSERLNALELTKRMAWIYGGVAEALGVELEEEKRKIVSRRERAERLGTQQSLVEHRTRLLYERFSRFPNLSSIAAARFIHDHPDKTRAYWNSLDAAIQQNFAAHRRTYRLLTQVRPSNIPKTDQQVNAKRSHRKNLNGVMFSSKWLSQDLGLSAAEAVSLRTAVDQAHQAEGFGDTSPSDWWVLLLADGDGMGQYVSGRKLKSYDNYILEDLVNPAGIEEHLPALLKTKKRMGPATHVGLNRALLDFSNRLVPHLTEHRYCGKVIYSGGDDVLVALPLADLPGYVRSLRAAWCGDEDPEKQFDNKGNSGYWHPPLEGVDHLPQRPLFTMGKGATMSMGIVIAHKSVPLPTVLENLWEAEKEQAKKMLGGTSADNEALISDKDGLCFRVVYGSGNTLEALMKGHLLDDWWAIVKHYDASFDLSPVFNRLAEDLPIHAAVTECHQLCAQAANAILLRREDQLTEEAKTAILTFLSNWEAWAWAAQQKAKQSTDSSKKAKGTDMDDLAALLKFTAFWISRQRQELNWVDGLEQSGQSNPVQSNSLEASHVNT